MLRDLAYFVGATSLFSAHDGFAWSTVVILILLSFWLGVATGVILTLLAVSPSLRTFLRRALLQLLADEHPARGRLERYRRD